MILVMGKLVKVPQQAPLQSFTCGVFGCNMGRITDSGYEDLSS